MNEYKITYTCIDPNEDGSTQRGNCRIIERTEAAARATAKKAAKAEGRPIQIDDVELISTNACATKQQERDTLEKIKAMVEELGPQSYIATAFEGCFRDAEDNIEDDAAYSMKGRWESAEEQIGALKAQVAELQGKLAESEKDYEAAHAAAHEIAEQKDAEIAALKKRVLSPDDLEDCRAMLDNRAYEQDEAATSAAAEIVKYADDPTAPEFQSAVSEHRRLTKEAAYCKALRDRIHHAMTAGA